MLEPMSFPPAQTHQKARFGAGILATAFLSSDIRSEYCGLKERGVKFRGQPKSMGPITAVLIEDTCGKLGNLLQPTA